MDGSSVHCLLLLLTSYHCRLAHRRLGVRGANQRRDVYFASSISSESKNGVASKRLLGAMSVSLLLGLVYLISELLLKRINEESRNAGNEQQNLQGTAKRTSAVPRPPPLQLGRSHRQRLQFSQATRLPLQLFSSCIVSRLR